MKRKQPLIWVSYFFMFFLIQMTLEAQEPVILDSKMKSGLSNDMRIEELKVRWKKAALENCPGVPCVTTPPVPSFTCGTSKVIDIDGNQYNTVLIGSTQCWLKENLRVTKYNDGSPITLDASGTSTGNGVGETWGNRTTEAYTIYEHNNSNVATYGLLYNWFAAVDARKLCPDGWHVPSDGEWSTLISLVDISGLVAGGKLKQSGLTLWGSPNIGADNSSGFTGLPGGYRASLGTFVTKGSLAYFWSTTKYNNNIHAYYYFLDKDDSDFERDWLDYEVGMSIRCLKN